MWINVVYVIMSSTGRSSVPEIFFNDRLIGGFEELEQLDKEGKLDAQIQECLQGPNVDFPPPYRKPKSEEFLKVSDQYREHGFYFSLLACTFTLYLARAL